MKKVIFLFIFLLFPNNIFSEEELNFDISIPEDMVRIDTEDNYYKWASKNEDELPNINVVQGENKNYNIDLFDDEDILSYEEYVENELNNELKEYEINIDVYDSDIVVINDRNSLMYKTKWDTMESYGYDTYQISYVFTTKNYLTTVTFTAKSEEEVNSEVFKNVINSFVIEDEDIVIQNNSTKLIVIFAVGGAFIGLIFSLIFNRKKRKK